MSFLKIDPTQEDVDKEIVKLAEELGKMAREIRKRKAQSSFLGVLEARAAQQIVKEKRLDDMEDALFHSLEVMKVRGVKYDFVLIDEADPYPQLQQIPREKDIAAKRDKKLERKTSTLRSNMEGKEKQERQQQFKEEFSLLMRLVEMYGFIRNREAEEGKQAKAPRHIVLKTLLRLDVLEALECELRPSEEDPCPVCGDTEHRPYRDDLIPQVRDFLIQLSDEDILCRTCYGFGWVHISMTNCQFAMESDEHHHIESCMQCDAGRVLQKDWDLGVHQQAVRLHEVQCGCDFFQHDCDHYNHPSDNSERGTVTGRMSSRALPPGSDPSPFQNESLEDKTMAAPMKKTDADSELAQQLEKFSNVSVRKANSKELPVITLPEEMTYDGAIYWLKKKKEDEEKEIAIDHKFPGYYPPDAALALHKAIERTWGFASQEGTPTFFSIRPPAKIGIEESLGQVIQIPWGRLTFHGVEGWVETRIAFVDGFPVMQLAGVIRKGDADKIDRLVTKVWEVLKDESIYRGQAIQVDFSNFHPDDPRFDPMKAPKFIDLTNTSVDDLVLSADVHEMVETNLFTPVQHTEAARKAKVPLRRGVLLAGPFGTGKTLTARVTAKLCVQNGWTYIYITDIKQLALALTFAQNYAPAVIFGEDIDRILDGDRDEEMDKYLNSMDGIDRKNHEVMVVFTTNNVENINPGFMRPGRIDAVIPINPPDADAMARLLFKYGTGLIDPNADLSKVGELLAGQIPAAARETMERSKLRAIRDASARADGEVIITALHLEQAGREVLKHMEFVNPVKVEPRHPAEVFATAFADKLSKAFRARPGQDNLNRLTAAEDLVPGLVVMGEQVVKENPSLHPKNGH